MKAALYARVSTAEEKELQDPETQLLILREWAKGQGHEVVGEFVDHASGKSTDRRPAFKEVISLAENGRVEIIAVLRLDRFMRDVVEGMNCCRRLQRAGCALVLVKDAMLGQVDTSTTMGEFFLTVVFAIGQVERRLIAERSREGISRYIKENGAWGKRERTDVNTELAVELLKLKSLSETARIMRIPRNTLRDHLLREGVDIPTRTPCRNTPPRKTAPPLYIPEGTADLPEYARNPTVGTGESEQPPDHTTRKNRGPL